MEGVRVGPLEGSLGGREGGSLVAGSRHLRGVQPPKVATQLRAQGVGAMRRLEQRPIRQPAIFR